MLTPEDLTQISNLVNTAVNSATAELRERIEETETKLLTEFHKWAGPSDARQKSHAAAIRALDLENEALSERIDRLEGDQPQ